MRRSVEVFYEGLDFGEGPRWHDGRLWVSDFYPHRVQSFGPTGDYRLELEWDDRPSGLGWLPSGDLLVVAMNSRQIRRIDASGKKWVIFTDPAGKAELVLDAHRFLRDVLFEPAGVAPEAYWHRPIVVTDMRTTLGDVIGRMQVRPEHAEDDVIDNDLILAWGKEKRIITGADLLGRLLRGIATREALPRRTGDAPTPPR